MMLTAAGAILPEGSCIFHIQATQLTYTRPHPGDVITDNSDSRRYSIDRVEVMDEGRRYRITAIPEVG
jgi:hypothetical protein